MGRCPSDFSYESWEVGIVVEAMEEEDGRCGGAVLKQIMNMYGKVKCT